MLQLEAMGSFFVGGREVEQTGLPVRSAAFSSATTVTFDPNGHYAIEQAYVQWFRPATCVTERPLLLVHGGGLTGATWETTPDGRPGWLELLLRRGFPVYVIDNVERGRAGWCALPGIWSGEPIMRNAEWAWQLFRFGPVGGYPDRPFRGQRFPVVHMAEFLRSFVPRWVTTNDVQTAALIEAIRRIGPLDIICHSHGGELSFRAAAACPELVRAVVALEPAGYNDALDPARQRVLTVLGDFANADQYAAGRDAAMRAFAARLSARGVRSELWDMAARGRPGHSHMLMMDSGSDALAEDVADWLLRG